MSRYKLQGHSNTLKVLSGAAAVCLLATMTTVGLQGQQAKSPADAASWVLDDGTGGCSLKEQVAVDKSRIVNIDPAHRELAIQVLEDKSSVLLSDKRFKEFASGSPPSKDLSNLKPYLVRAVSASTANRSISVRLCRQDLLVFSGSLGGDKPQKDPVVVFLSSKPKKVFVSYMSAK